MDIVKLAYQIIKLSEECDYWRSEALHYKDMHEKDMESTMRSIRQHEENIGKVLSACLDPNSGINRMTRAIARDPLKGAEQ